MEIFEKLSHNPLIVSVVTLVLTTFISLMGYIMKKIIDINKKEKNDTKEIYQNNMIQNFHTGMNYSDVERIAEDVVNRELSKMKKQ